MRFSSILLQVVFCKEHASAKDGSLFPHRLQLFTLVLGASLTPVLMLLQATPIRGRLTVAALIR